MNSDPQFQSYLRYYAQQQGGQLPTVFRGSRRWQHGDGFGDWLRRAFSFILPIAASSAQTFLKETVDAREKGATWKDAAKGALRPTLQSGISTAVKRFTAPPQDGSGGKKRKRVKKQQVRKSAAQKGGKTRKPAARKRVYKAKTTKKTMKSKKLPSKRKAKSQATEFNF